MNKKVRVVLVWSLLFVLILGMNFPLFWLFMSSIEPEAEMYSSPPRLVPTSITAEHYLRVLFQTGLPLSLGNSAYVAISTALITILVSGTAAYGLSRFKFRFRNVSKQLLFTFYMLPPVMLGLSFARIFVPLGLYDNLNGLILADLTNTTPFCTLILWPFFDAIPPEIDQAAMIDGSSRLRAFVSIILPCALRGVLTTGIFSFIFSWNDYTYALFLIRSVGIRTASLTVSDLITTEMGVRWPQLLPATVLMTIPAIIAFILIEDSLVKGLGAI